MKLDATTQLQEAGETWISVRQAAHRLAPKSARIYRQHFKATADAMGNPRVGDVTFDRVLEWQLKSMGHLAARTQYNRISALTSLFDWLILNEYLDGANPFRRLERPKLKPANVPPAPVGALDQVAEHVKPRERLMFLLAAKLGLRRFEIAKIRYHEINWAERKLRVVGKGEIPKDLPIPPTVLEALDAWVAANEIEGRAPIFPGRQKGRPITADQVGRLMTDAANRYARSHITPHQWRHRAATSMSEAYGLKAAQQLLRHASPATTDIYVQDNVELLRQQMESLDDPETPEAA